MDSYLVLFHVPHQVFGLNTQISAEREGSQEKSRLNTTLSGAESLPPAPAYAQGSEQEAALHPSWVLEGRHWPDFFIRPINRLKLAQETHFGFDLTKTLWLFQHHHPPPNPTCHQILPSRCQGRQVAQPCREPEKELTQQHHGVPLPSQECIWASEQMGWSIWWHLKGLKREMVWGCVPGSRWSPVKTDPLWWGAKVTAPAPKHDLPWAVRSTL